MQKLTPALILVVASVIALVLHIATGSPLWWALLLLILAVLLR